MRVLLTVDCHHTTWKCARVAVVWLIMIFAVVTEAERIKQPAFKKRQVYTIGLHIIMDVRERQR